MNTNASTPMPTDSPLPDVRLPKDPAAGNARRTGWPGMRWLLGRTPHWGLLLVLGWLVQAGIRLWLAIDQTVPVATPDETGYLLAARVLSGGPDADISASTIYTGGYPLLLVPAFWISDDPVTVYRLAIGINALVSATVLILAYLLLRRLGLTRGQSYLLGHATALLPAVVFYSQYALSDAIMPVVMLGWLLLLHSWLVSKASPAWVSLYGIGACLVAAYAYTSHVRGLVVLVVQIGLLVVVAVRKWRSRWSTALVAAALAAAVSAGALLNLWLTPHLYPAGGYDLRANLTERLTTLDGYGWIMQVGTGQLWYQVIATGGLAGVGLVTLVAVGLRRSTPSRVRALAIAVIITVAGISFATSAALPDEHRVGNYAYSRYLACLVPVLFAVGIAALLRSSRRVAIRAGVAAAGLAGIGAVVVQRYAGERLHTYIYLPFDFPETAFFTWNWTEFRLWPATIVALALLVLISMAAQIPQRAAAVVAGILILVNLAAITSATMRISRPLVRHSAEAIDLKSAIIQGAHETVAIDLYVNWPIRLPQLYQVGWMEAVGFDGRYEKPPVEADVVVYAWDKGISAEATWPGVPTGWRVAESRRTNEGDWVAWRRP